MRASESVAMWVSPARRIAFDVLCRVCSEGAYASELLNVRLEPRVGRADAALATELTLGVLRWQRLLDFLLERRLARTADQLDLEVLLALRLGLYQLRFLDRVPAHAAVSESVELAKRAKKRSAGALVNAVLRRVAAEAKVSAEDLARMLPPDVPAGERLGILHSHPTWLVERWLAAFGEVRTIALLQANNRAPRLCCAVYDPREAEAIAESLRRDGFDVSPGRWLRSALTISGGNPTAARAFRDGRVSLQDEASQMVAQLVDARPGQRVLDVCAAPGGKTIWLAHAVGPQGSVIATDLHTHRLRATRVQLERTHTSNVELVQIDATRPLPFPRSFDRILVDAPCSGTGTLARNPEIRWRLTPEDLVRVRKMQVAILRNTLDLLAPDGRLVYSTCSLEAEENEQVVAEVISQDASVRLVASGAPLTQYMHGESLVDSDGYFRSFPPESETDGFFAATLERTDAA